MTQKDVAEKAVRDIRRKTRRKFSTEEIIHKLREADVLLGQEKPSARPANRSVSATRPTIARAKATAG